MSSLLDLPALFREHAPYLWRVLRRLGASATDAEDLCQEVFLVAHRNQATFRGDSSPRTWLYGIAVRVAADLRNKAHMRQERSVAVLPETLVEATQDDALEQQRARVLLDRALAGLDAERRAVFVLYEIEDLTLQEIADCLQVPLQTVYSRLKSARQEVLALFGETLVPGGTATLLEGSGR
ncbi:MAG: RNA polymerase sigma factor [Deltaproteobacteria bacterium]|nr:RNA polymerase sigma factor [Deltaproteobacteria bacterium]